MRKSCMPLLQRDVEFDFSNLPGQVNLQYSAKYHYTRAFDIIIPFLWKGRFFATEMTSTYFVANSLR